jgi:hypothetical protein
MMKRFMDIPSLVDLPRAGLNLERRNPAGGPSAALDWAHRETGPTDAE